MTNDFPDFDRVARMPVMDRDRYLPSSPVRSHRPNQRITTSPILCSPIRKMPPAEGFPVQNIFVPSAPLSEMVPDRKLSPAELANLSQEMGSSSSRRSNRRRASQKISGNAATSAEFNEGKGLKADLSEADFLIQNQQHFTEEDFSAVVAALAEEKRFDEMRKRQERDSIKLAQALVSSDIEESPAHKRSSTADDLAALVVALRAELDESNMQKKNEEESYRVACMLVEEESRTSGFDQSCGSSCEEKKDDYSSCDIQCQACHFDIEKKESVRELECGHQFHAFCINRYWLLMKKNDCPFCRRVVKQFRYR